VSKSQPGSRKGEGTQALNGPCARDGDRRVNRITIPDDRWPVVDYPFTDDLDQPLIRNRTEEEAHG